MLLHCIMLIILPSERGLRCSSVCSNMAAARGKGRNGERHFETPRRELDISVRTKYRLQQTPGKVHREGKKRAVQWSWNKYSRQKGRESPVPFVRDIWRTPKNRQRSVWAALVTSQQHDTAPLAPPCTVIRQIYVITRHYKCDTCAALPTLTLRAGYMFPSPLFSTSTRTMTT
jgi:hypothetical protein